MRLLPVTLAFAVASVATLLPVNQALADDVTIYRCAAADGSVTLRDSQCLDGETQQVRKMARPQDPPPAASNAEPPRPVYYQPPESAYDGVSSGGGMDYGRPVYWAPAPAPAPSQQKNWGQGSWVKGSWTDSGSWTDR
ncbi:MAG: hypothetical protein M3Y70_10760 [Pseudomonadota bacterium]|nr:hypothetical protein [Pseudomonadota bacterium]